jgi:glycosyltransferase involved in cell wall biosynthesis
VAGDGRNAQVGRLRGAVFVGVGIFPHRVAGDKNFLLELSPHLHKHGIQTSFVSIVNVDEVPRTDGYTFVNRAFHGRSDRYIRRDENGNIIGYRHSHGTARTVLELTSTLLAEGRTIRAALRQYDRAVVHWMDSSLMIPALRAVCGEQHRYVTSVFRYLPSSRPASALRAQALKRTHRVFAGTEAARERLINDGCPSDRVVVEPWGCAARPQRLQAPDARSSQVRILWAGFLQQIGRTDLLRSLALAQRVRQQRPDVHFTFSLKPECFSQEYKAFEMPGIEVLAGGQSFLGELSSFDAFLSAVSEGESTPAPPLTWLEALAVGVPIVTTSHPGVDEVIVDGVSGIVAPDYEGLEQRLLQADLKSALQGMRQSARDQHTRRYDIETVAARYADVYHQLLSEKS